jgi:hypothetical protein
MTILFGGGGGCVRQSINFHTPITTRITAAVAIHKRAARSFPLITYCRPPMSCLLREGIDSFGQTKIELGQTTLAVS